MSQVETVQMINGVDVTALAQTVEAIRNEKSLGRFQFRARNRWLGADHNRTTIKGFYGAGKEDDTRTEPFVMDCGEPAVLLGHDRGANPVEYLLNALAGCITTTMAYHAASRGIEIESIESELEGDIDIRGFLGLSNDVPKGFQNIRVTMRVKSDATPEKLRELARMSPVFNTITMPTPVNVEVVVR